MRFALIAGLGFLLLACGQVDTDKQDVATASDGSPLGTRGPVAGVIRKANGAEPKTLDPHRAEDVTSSNILRDLFEPLVGEAPDGSLTAGAAKSWRISNDGKTYTFKIDPAARWSNGDAVTANDFVFSLQRSVDPATGSHYAMILAPINNAEAVIKGELPPSDLGVKALDATTLEITLHAATPYFLGLLTHSTAYPVHPASVKQHGSKFTQPANLITNGAYQLAEWQVQSHIKLSAQSHWRKPHGVHTVYYLPIDDQEAALKRYRANEIDYNDSLPLGKCEWVRDNLADDLETHAYLGTYYFGLNTTRPPFNNPDIRKALSLAVDRELLIDKILKCGQIPAYSWVPPNVNGYQQQQPEWAGWQQAKRDAEAKALYAKAGFNADKPLEFELLYNTSEGHKKIATVLAAMWKQKLGAKVELRNQEWKVFLNTKRNQAKTQMFRAGWIGDYNDAYTFAEILLGGHGMNDQGWDNSEYNALLLASTTETNLVKRQQLLQQAEQILLAEQPIIPLYFYVNNSLLKPWVKGYQGNVMDHHFSYRWSINTSQKETK